MAARWAALPAHEHDGFLPGGREADRRESQQAGRTAVVVLELTPHPLVAPRDRDLTRRDGDDVVVAVGDRMQIDRVGRVLEERGIARRGARRSGDVRPPRRLDPPALLERRALYARARRIERGGDD